MHDHDRLPAILAAADAFVAESAERTPALLRKSSGFAERAGRFQSWEVSGMRADVGTAESALMRGQRILDDLDLERQRLLDEARRAGRGAIDDSVIEATSGRVGAALQPWRSVEAAFRGWITQAEQVGWANGG